MVLSGVITEVEPEGLPASIEIEKSRVTFQPLLLNPKDTVTLKLLVSDFAGTVAIDGRVVGVKTISRAGQTTGHQALLMLAALALFAIGAFLIISFSPKPEVRPSSPIEVKIGFVTLGVGYLAMIAILLKNRSMRTMIRRFLRVVGG